MTGGLTLCLYGTTYYDNVMSVFVLPALAILVVNREALRDGPLMKSAALWCALGGFLTGSAGRPQTARSAVRVGFAPRCWRSAATANMRRRGLWRGGIGGDRRLRCCSRGHWMLQMDACSPAIRCFPISTSFPFAAGAGRALSRYALPADAFLERGCCFPCCSRSTGMSPTICPSGYPRRALPISSSSRRSSSGWPANARKIRWSSPSRRRIMFAFAAVVLFRLAQDLRHLPLHPDAGDAGAAPDRPSRSGLLPLSRRSRLIAIGALFFAAMLFTRGAMSGARPARRSLYRCATAAHHRTRRHHGADDGDAPLGFIAPSLPPQMPVLRIDGWMMQPEDGTHADPPDEGAGLWPSKARPVPDRRRL